MSHHARPNPPPSPQLRLVQRETILLVALCLIAIVAFLATRRVAAANRSRQREDAAHWYALGQAALARHDAAAATTSLRRASGLNRDNRDYRLALAAALSANGDNQAARDVLVELQTREPQDPDVNLRLARLDVAAGRGDSAVREYQTAVLEMWAPGRNDERRQVRVELIEFLLGRRDVGRALSEAIALTADIPDEPAAHVQAGLLLLRCGAPTRALEQFQTALREAPDQPDALTGAADSAFQTGDYDHARQYLRAAPSSPHLDELRTLVNLMYEIDPLLPHLTTVARVERVRAALDRLSDQIAACGPVADGLGAEASAISDSLKGRRSADSIGADLGSVARLAGRVANTCGQQPLDRALGLVAKRHGVDQP